MAGRPCEDMEEIAVFKLKGEGPRRNPPWADDLKVGFLASRAMSQYFCCVSFPACGICCSSLSLLVNLDSHKNLSLNVYCGFVHSYQGQKPLSCPPPAGRWIDTPCFFCRHQSAWSRMRCWSCGSMPGFSDNTLLSGKARLARLPSTVVYLDGVRGKVELQ